MESILSDSPGDQSEEFVCAYWAEKVTEANSKETKILYGSTYVQCFQTKSCHLIQGAVQAYQSNNTSSLLCRQFHSATRWHLH